MLQAVLVDGKLPKDRTLVVASEYERLSREWLRKQNLRYVFRRTYGATEVFPPEDADVIIDNTATGSTLQANNLRVVGEVRRSSTHLVMHPDVKDSPDKMAIIDRFVTLLDSAIRARGRVVVECNGSVWGRSLCSRCASAHAVHG